MKPKYTMVTGSTRKGYACHGVFNDPIEAVEWATDTEAFEGEGSPEDIPMDYSADWCVMPIHQVEA